ncbi:PhzF family phenazine biosynthesis protein [Tatumella morbirosei]|uniref:PhzF family phenazine biosynthesis protein n=1 Tax=Tatumella morbirosei TaxID=642227 RepID=A0A095VQ45_9GAMM|nr:PhzF family phenazine biosynthesis protein [Tatumella morbirosei]KGD76765.1 PhzF family phenazine biosynthesis protein [Tatumella morbirosei]
MQYPASELVHIAAFSDTGQGGNPAGVWVGTQFPTDEEMQKIAADVGFSETAFAVPLDDTHRLWRVRYFSPEAEVPFCGHATIATTTGIAGRYGAGDYQFQLNLTSIPVSAQPDESGNWQATLLSPPTHSQPVDPSLVDQALQLFGYTREDLDQRIPPARIHGGADHLILTLKQRSQLAAMHYSQAEGGVLMRDNGWVTILLVVAEDEQHFHTRNPFAYGGVYEDPATGAASAAFAGYLRDIGWPHHGEIEIIQGEDMGIRSRIIAKITEQPGSPIAVSGQARLME